MTTPAEAVARQFYESDERYAPAFGYQTPNPWGEVPEPLRQLMIAVCADVLSRKALSVAG